MEKIAILDMAAGLLEPAVRNWASQNGLVMGDFKPTRNILDTVEERRFNEMKQRALGIATSRDDTPIRLLKGYYNMVGQPWGPEMDRQAEAIRTGYAGLAPYIMRWSPGWWDALHGSTGSVATLASAIADVNRQEGMSAPQAASIAENVFQHMYADPMRHRGFSARELGNIVAAAAKRGYLLPGMGAGQLIASLPSLVGAVSAVRDALGEQGGDPNDIETIFEALDRVVPSALAKGKGWQDIEKQIHKDRILSRYGGEMGAALRLAGMPAGPGSGGAAGIGAGGSAVDLATLAAQNEQLSEQAARSSTMAMYEALARAVDAGLVRPGSAAAQLLQQWDAGKFVGQISGRKGITQILQPAQWAQIIAKSARNLSPAGAMQLYTQALQRAQFGARSPYITSERIAALRGAQAQIDHAPYIQAIMRQFAGKGEAANSLRQGALDAFARSRGFENLEHYNTLHGAPAQKLLAIQQDAGNRAQEMARMTQYGRTVSPIARVIDKFKLPGTTLSGAGQGLFNVTPVPGAQNMLTSAGTASGIPAGYGASLISTRKTAADTNTAGAAEGSADPFATSEKAAGIRGIPDPKDLGDLGKLPPDQLADLIIQHHRAQRAGLHADVRVGNPQLGLYSWSMKPLDLPVPGKKRYVARQPLHSHAYGSFQGTLGKGYGKGEVRRAAKEKVLITKASPTKIEYTVASKGHPERYILFKPETWQARDWLLVNVTPTKPLPYEKVRYKRLPAEAVEPYIDQMAEGTSVQAKIDGASSLVKLMRRGAEITSYRVNAAGQPIVHTERVFGKRPRLDTLPPELEGTVLKGELYGIQQPKGKDRVRQKERSQDYRSGRLGADTEADGRPEIGADAVDGVVGGQPGDGGARRGAGRRRDAGNGVVIKPQALGGLLNATIEHSRAAQKRDKIKLQNMLYDIQRHGKQHIDPDVVPYAERRKLIEGVLPYLPADVFHMADTATTPEDARALWQSIAAKQHPLTTEGVVIHPPTGKPLKAKLLEEADVHIADVIPGAGKYRGRGAGGFAYSLEPGGPVVGRVGTGLSDELRSQMWRNPEAFRGRVARIHSQEQHPSGAWRAPALIALHEDY